MKKLFLLAGIYCLHLTTQAQSATSRTIDFPKKNLQTMDNLKEAGSESVEAAVNAKAVRDFRTGFPAVQNETWRIFPDKEILCTFRQSGTLIHIYYGKRGVRKLMISSYEGDQLDKDVAERLTDYYKGYQISHVNEINIPGLPTSYVVNIKSLDRIKIVRVSGDEMDEQQEIETQ